MQAAAQPMQQAAPNVAIGADMRRLQAGDILPANVSMLCPKEMVVVDLAKFTELVTTNGNLASLPFPVGTLIVTPGINIGILVDMHDVAIVCITTSLLPSLSLGHRVLDCKVDYVPLQRFKRTLHEHVHEQPSMHALHTTPTRSVFPIFETPINKTAIPPNTPSEAQRHALTNANTENAVLRSRNVELLQQIEAIQASAIAPARIDAPAPHVQMAAGAPGGQPGSGTAQDSQGELPAAYNSLITAIQQLIPGSAAMPGLLTPRLPSHTTPIRAVPEHTEPVCISTAASARKEWKVLYSMEKFMHKPGSNGYTSHQFKNWLNVTLELGMKHFFCMSVNAPDDSLPSGWAEYLGHLIDPQFFKTHILPVAHTLTMSSFKNLAIKAYAPSIRSDADIARQKIIGGLVTQGHRSVAAYTSFFTEQMLLIPDMAESDRIAYYRRGLRSGIREQCAANFRVHPPRPFIDLMDLQQYAAWIELDLQERSRDPAPKHYASSRPFSHQRRTHSASAPVVAPVMGVDPRNRNRTQSRTHNPPTQQKRPNSSASGSREDQQKKFRAEKDKVLQMLMENPDKVSTAPHEYGRRFSVLYVCRRKQLCPKCFKPHHGSWGSVECSRAADPADGFMQQFKELKAQHDARPVPMHTN